MRVGDVSETELTARIQACLPPAPDWLIAGIGDDAAIVEPERNQVEVLSVDALVEGGHFHRAVVPPRAIGYRAPAGHPSDLAATCVRARRVGAVGRGLPDLFGCARSLWSSVAC